MDECPRFCDNCPMIPKGVIAALTGAKVLTMTDMRQFRFAHTNPEAAEIFVGQTRIEATVVASEVDGVEKGDKSGMIVQADGNGLNELKELVAACAGPISVNVLQRIFRVRTRCGAVDNRQMSRD